MQSTNQPRNIKTILVNIATKVVFDTDPLMVLTEYMEQLTKRAAANHKLHHHHLPIPFVPPTQEEMLADVKPVFKAAMREAEHRRIKGGSRFKDLSGKEQYGLTVLRTTGFKNELGYVMWHCHCLCGNRCIKTSQQLKMGAKTCSNSKFRCSREVVYRKRRISDQTKQTATYQRWWHMKNRCENPNAQQWDRYGGAGITVNSRWRLFEGFVADMGEAPESAVEWNEDAQRELTYHGTAQLRRINTDGNYEPENCHWHFAKDRDPHVIYEPSVQEVRESLTRETGTQVQDDIDLVAELNALLSKDEVH